MLDINVANFTYYNPQCLEKKNNEELTLLTNVGVLARLVVFWITGVPARNTSTLLMRLRTDINSNHPMIHRKGDCYYIPILSHA
jgi:hypothetical protein